MSDSRLFVPALEKKPWPTLGPEVCDWIEDHCVHGPGDILGESVELTDEERLLLYRAYEIFPRGHRRVGRRRFKRVVYSRRKGTRKTELAAWIAIAELDPTAPVRFDGWKREGSGYVPVGRPVNGPYIPMLATTEGQAEDLAYGAVYEILTHENCSLVDSYDVGLERITPIGAAGKLQALASSPDARDGARTSFQHFDETHLFEKKKLKNSHTTMLRNIPKRAMADPWSLETTTMYAPGGNSVAEDSHTYAQAIERGEVEDSTLLFDHRQASESHDIKTDKGLRAAIIEASGDAIAWTDVDGIVSLFRDPANKEPDSRRYWLNQKRKSDSKFLNLDLWDPLRKKRRIPDESEIVLAFDGSYSRDSTALVACTVEDTPHIFVVKVWEKPVGSKPTWRTPRNEVDDVIAATMEKYTVLELAPDPFGWGREIEDWEATYEEVVVQFPTNQPQRFGKACDDFYQAVCDGELTQYGTQKGEDVLRRHLGNAVEFNRRGYRVIDKSDSDSPDKVDAAVGAIVAHHRAIWHRENQEEETEVTFTLV